MTLSFVGVIFFGVIGALALWHQARLIKQNKSGRSVSVLWYLMTLSSSAIFLIYGWNRDLLALVCLFFLRAPLTFLILKRLWEFKGFVLKEQMFGLTVASAVVWMIFSVEQDLIYLIFTTTSVVMAILPPHKIWSEQDRGMVSILPPLTSLGSAIFWTYYGLMVENEFVWRTSTCHIVLNIAMILAWRAYPRQEVAI